MNKYVNQTPSVRLVLLAAGTVIIVAGMYAASSFLVPILLAVLFAVVFWPFLLNLQRKGLSTGLALGIVLLGVILVALLLVAGLGLTVVNFADSLPLYYQNLSKQMDVLAEMFQRVGVDLTNLMEPAEKKGAALGKIFGFVISGLGQLLSSSFIILFYVIFMLVEATSFQKKIRAAFGNKDRAYGYLSRVTDSLQHYLIIKTRINLVTGVFIGATMWMLGLDFAVLWGFLAFLLNYVPNFGSIIAAVPAVILAFIQFGPSVKLLAIIGVYLLVNLAVGYWLEPKLMGRGLGLSALVVLIAVMFWGWILGPIGLILSVPITVALKIFLESYEGSRWLAVILEAEDELEDTH